MYDDHDYDYSKGTLRAMCSPFFPDLRKILGPYLIDKTQLIENIVVSGCPTGDVDLVLRPRRCGKSTMLQMLNSFFSTPQDGLYIASRQDLCAEHMGKYPVIFLDFKNLTGTSWEEMLSDFKDCVSDLYRKWEIRLMESLDPGERTYFESICGKRGTEGDMEMSLSILSYFIARKYGQPVIVLIDEYEAPINFAFDHDYFEKANEFFWHGVLPPLLKSNENLRYAVLAGITPAAKSGWYSALNNLQTHALHIPNSIFAGMLMFTEFEVDRLRILIDSELELKELKDHYNSYIAAGDISVYNPDSVMHALAETSIGDFWLMTGKLLYDRDDAIKRLFAKKEIDFTLKESVTFSSDASTIDETLMILYYAGHLTKTANGQFKIPNPEVRRNWEGWVFDDVRLVCSDNSTKASPEGEKDYK